MQEKNPTLDWPFMNILKCLKLKKKIKWVGVFKFTNIGYSNFTLHNKTIYLRVIN